MCVTLAGIINALKLAGKKMSEAKFVFLLGAGASNTTGLRLILTAGGDPQKFIMFDTKGGLHKNRLDVKADPRNNHCKWEVCEHTNPACINMIEEADPNVVKPE